MRAWRDDLADHLGRRGVTLLTLGVVWLLMAASIPSAPLTPGDPPHEMLPVPVRVALWALPGTVALFAAAKGKEETNPKAFALAFGLLVLGPAIRAASFGVAWVIYLLPPAGDGDPRGWIFAAIWTAIAILIRIVAGWEETPPRRLREDVLS